MAKIVPIKGVRYTTAAGDLSSLLAPPYDVVNEEQQRELLESDPHNASHLEMPAGSSARYSAAADTLRAWTSDGVVARDPETMFYVYEQAFLEGGIERRRRCLLSGVEAQPWEEGAVKPHEFTMSGPKDDRLKLLEAARVQFSPVMMIARDRAGHLQQLIDETVALPPDQEGTVEGETHRLWAIPGDSFTKRRLAPLNSESFYIADGHHRYETAVTYKDSKLDSGGLKPDHPARFVLAGIVSAEDAGLVIRPIHRVIPRRAPDDWRKTVEEVFNIESVPEGSDPAATAVQILGARPDTIVAAGLEAGSLHILTTRDQAVITERAPKGHSDLWANIQPNVVRYGLLGPLWGLTDDDIRAGAVEYTHDELEALSGVDGSGESIVFLIHAVSVDDVITLADRGERMPQKSTFFHPKLGTGLVFHQLEV